jgi:outer membrane protein OmpA-like peptidoglycan-associated protein
MRFADRQNPAAASAIRRPPSALPADVGDWGPSTGLRAGRPLEPDVRKSFERRFDHDFSSVRVHADAAAASSARTAAAEAYTVGSDVVFGAGMYRPHAHAGQRLLAHELAHVVQQQRPSSGAAKTSAHESDAARAADRAVNGHKAAVSLAAPVSVQRQPLTGNVPDVDLTESASPLLASAIGSVTVDGFVTGKADLSVANQAELTRAAATIFKLLKRYPASTIRVIGYTDAVGQEADNQTLGQSRADAVQAALRDLGIPDAAMHAESRGPADPVVKTTKAEARNRRVEVRFDTSTLGRGLMSQGLTLGGSDRTGQTDTGTGGGMGTGGTDVRKVCEKYPKLCEPPPGNIFQPIPDNTPYHRMDLVGVGRPGERGDLSKTWAQLYWKYRRLGLSEERAAWLANKELSATSEKEQSRNNPSPADQLDTEMQRGYPNATKVGPGSIELFRF